MRDCVAVVAAMATGTTLAQVKAEVDEHPEGGYSDIDFIAYCARHGIVAGAWQWAPDTKAAEQAMDMGGLLIRMDHPAYVGVRSERREGKGHAIYWDGKQVWDPNPDTSDGRPLSSYQIDLWWPLLRSSDGAAYLSKRFEQWGVIAKGGPTP